MKQLFALIRGYESSLEAKAFDVEVGSSKKKEAKIKIPRKVSSILKDLFGIAIIALIVTGVISPFIEMINNFYMQEEVVRSMLIPGFSIVMLMMTLFFTFFTTIMNASNTEKSSIFQIYPVSHFKKFLANMIISMKSSVSLGIVGILTVLLNITFRTNLSFDVLSLIVCSTIAVILPIPVILITHTIAKIIATILSKLVSKKVLDGIFTTLGVLVFLAIYISSSMELIDLNKIVEAVPYAKNIIEFIQKTVTTLQEAVVSSNYMEVIGILGGFALLFSALTYIVSQIDKILDNELRKSSNSSGILTKVKTADEITKKTDKELTNNKVVGKDRAYINREIKFYLNSPYLLLNIVVPTILIPVILIGSFIFGFTNESKKQEKDIKEFRIQLVNYDEERKEETTKIINGFEFKEENIQVFNQFNEIESEEELMEKLANGSITFGNLTEEYKVESLLELVVSLKRYEQGEVIKNSILGVFKTGIPQEIIDGIPVDILAYVIMGMVAYMALIENISIIAISKDKAEVQVLKTYPIDLKKQYEYKLLFARILIFGTMAFYLGIAGLLLRGAIFKVPAILAILIGIVFTEIKLNIGILLDLFRPNFDWKKIEEVSKNSTNSLIILAIVAAIVGLNVYGIIKLRAFDFELVKILIIVLSELLMMLTGIIIFKEKEVEKRFMKLDK